MEFETDFSLVPLSALKSSTRAKLSSVLDIHMNIRLTKDGLLRDWRGLAELAGYNHGDVLRLLHNKAKPTEDLLQHWQAQRATTKNVNVSIQLLVNNLEKLERFDVLDDLVENYFRRDAMSYFEQKEHAESSSSVAAEAVEVSSTTNSVSTESDYQDPITIHDSPMAVQKYNAYVCSTESDASFVRELIDYVEGKLKMKLYVKDRDLLIGVFEHEAAIKLIQERCDKMLVVLSPDFLRNKMLAFQTMLAQAVSLEECKRKVIPIIYKPCQLPSMFRFVAKLDYSTNSFNCFWDRLRDALQEPAMRSTSLLSVPTSNTACSSDEEANDSSTSDYYSSSPNLQSLSTTTSQLRTLETSYQRTHSVNDLPNSASVEGSNAVSLNSKKILLTPPLIHKPVHHRSFFSMFSRHRKRKDRSEVKS